MQEIVNVARAEGAKISTVNIMTFDYYLGTTENMLSDAESAATAVHGQLASLYPGLSSRALWEMIGVTQMPGIDDFGTAETFTTAQAPAFAIWAAVKGLGEISMWALQRDNGNCPGTKGAGSCSGVAQPVRDRLHVERRKATESWTPATRRSIASPASAPRWNVTR